MIRMVWSVGRVLPVQTSNSVFMCLSPTRVLPGAGRRAEVTFDPHSGSQADAERPVEGDQGAEFGRLALDRGLMLSIHSCGSRVPPLPNPHSSRPLPNRKQLPCK